MNNFDKVQAYDNYTRISLPNTYYQCACLNPELDQLYILDSTGMLVTVDLMAQSVTSTISIGLLNQKKCFFSKHPTNQVIFA